MHHSTVNLIATLLIPFDLVVNILPTSCRSPPLPAKNNKKFIHSLT